MDREAQRRLDGIRVRRTELENSVIDEMLAGRISRREFVRAGSVIGISLPVLGAILAACSSGTTTAPSTGGVKKGGRLNMGHQTPSGPMDPILTADLGASRSSAWQGSTSPSRTRT